MSMKYFLLMLALALACFLGFIIGRLNIPTPINSVLDKTLNVLQERTDTAATSETKAETNTTSTPSVQQQNAVPSTITPTLTDAQKAMLTSFGINPDTFVITQTMITCAETKLGSTRMTEIKNGSKPTFFEGATLATCYR